MKQTEIRATEYVESKFSQISGLIHRPWPEFKDALIAIYLAGAKESLTNQWKDPKDELPKFGDKFLLRYRTKYKGTWLTITEVDTRRD